MSSNFRYQSFVTASGNLGEKVPVVENALSSREQEFYPTTSLHENCIEIELQTDRNCHVDLREMYCAFKLKFVKGRGYEFYKNAKVDGETEEEYPDVPVFLVTRLDNNLRLIFPMLKTTWTISKFTTQMECMRTNLTFPTTSRRPSLNTREARAARGFDYEEFPVKIMEAFLSEPFFTRRMKMLSRADGFMLYGKLLVVFFPTSQLLYPNRNKIRARPNNYMISDNPNVCLGITDCSLYSRRIELKADYHKRRIDMVA